MGKIGYSPSLGQDVQEARPNLAFGLSLASGFLMGIEGLVYLWAANLVPSLASGPAANAASSVLSDLGGLALFFGFVVVILAIYLFARPESHTGVGISVLVLSLIALFTGGGFYLGTILGVLGGITAIIFETDEEPFDLPPALGPMIPSTSSRIPESRGVGPPAGMPPTQKVGCSRCGEIQPRHGAIQCRKCGSPLYRAGAGPSS
ncbi:MAG: hypothetical protein ACREDK_04205 [Thermoplasmata archaeon]